MTTTTSDEEYLLSDTSDKDYIPSKSQQKNSKQQRNKRKIIDSSDEDTTCTQNIVKNNNNHKPLPRKKKKKLVKQQTNTETDTTRNKKRNRNEFETGFEQEEMPYYFPSIDEMAQNIEQYEMDICDMAHTTDMEYKQNHNTENNNTNQCQEPQCNSVTICPMYLKHFGIYVCKECKWKAKYKCMTKTKAKQEYLLSEGDINSLKCWIKDIKKNNNIMFGNNNNNQNGAWMPKYIKLYLIYQLEQLSLEKYGSKQGIKKERKKREVNKMNRSISNARKKRKIKFECLDDIEIDKNLIEKQNMKAHVHEFGESECINEETDEWRKICVDCGYVETWEEF